ncbi:MAG: hypothetical protein HQK53_03820, partial [Oligoflexia bacterium]|nr:hypothetical protein [Oligoflexia bacterium]
MDMKKRLGHLFSSLFFFLFFISACSKNGLRPTLNLKVKLPTSVSKKSDNNLINISGKTVVPSSGESIVYVVINISGVGMNPIFKSWNTERLNDGTVSDSPSEVKIEILAGEDRLVQVLVVTQDLKWKESEKLTFYYGSVKDSIFTDKDIVVQARRMGGANRTSDFAGRYLYSPDQGPSGKVSVLMNAPNDDPPLKVDETYILNGWLSFFMIEGVPFRYVLDTTQEIIFDNVMPSSPYFADSERVIKIVVPSAY